MTHEEMLERLAPARLPESFANLQWGDVLALLGLGLLAGVALMLIIGPFLHRKPSKRARIIATRGQAPEYRILSIARILNRMPISLRDAAYGAKPPPKDEDIERIALRRRGK